MKIAFSVLLSLQALSFGQINYTEALQKSLIFYEAQASGPIPTWNRVHWRGPSGLKDGTDLGHDLTGGWYDAGDHVKFNFPMAFSATMLAWGGVEEKAAYVASGQYPHLLNNLKFVTDYLIRCHTAENELVGQVGKGSSDHAFWGPAESVEFVMERPAYKIDATHPGSDLAGETAAALASASMVFKESDPTYSAKLLLHAKQIYLFAETYKGSYSDAITDAAAFYRSWSGYQDELVWGAIWLFRATQDSSYLKKAEANYANLANEPQSTVKSFKWTLAWDDKSFGCYILLAQLTGKSIYHQDAQRWLDFWTVGTAGQKIAYTPGGQAWLDQWGSNRYAANTAFCAMMYAKTLTDASLKLRYDQFGETQIKYILGENPAHQSYLIGFGNHYPTHPHHRTAHGIYPSQSADTNTAKHVLMGALVGGPNKDDSYKDERNNYVNNEVACDYNAAFTGALAALVAKYGGKVIDPFPPAEVQSSPEFYVTASINVKGDMFTEIRAVLKNKSINPARPMQNLSFRYYFNISEFTGSNITIKDLIISKNYSQGKATVSEPKPTLDPNLYYLEINCAGENLYPGTEDSYKREIQFRIGLPPNSNAKYWNSDNDPSYAGLTTPNVAIEIDANIPVYSEGKHLFGNEFSTSTTFRKSSPQSKRFKVNLGLKNFTALGQKTFLEKGKK